MFRHSNLVHQEITFVYAPADISDLRLAIVTTRSELSQRTQEAATVGTFVSRGVLVSYNLDKVHFLWLLAIGSDTPTTLPNTP